MSIKGLIKQVLTEKENRRYNRLLARRRVSYRDWLKEREKLWAGKGISAYESGVGGGRSSENDVTLYAADEANTQFVLIFAADGVPASYAERSIRYFFRENPEAMVLYGDEDVLTAEGEYLAPWFKPDWSPDFLDSCLYFGSLLAVRIQHWKKMQEAYEADKPGRWQQIFGEENPTRIYRITDREAYEKWLHDCVREGYRKGSCFVGHLPQILFHGETEELQARFLQESDYLKLQRQGLLSRFFENSGNSVSGHKPVVTVVVPSKDHPDILQQCLKSVKKAGTDIPLEMIIVDNGSDAGNRASIENMVAQEASAERNGETVSIRYLYQPMEFNFSRMCNLGAEAAEGKLLLFLNDDVELEEECIAEMCARAMRPDTGAVGIKLLYPGTGRIQHAGITNLPMGPVHKLQSLSDDRDYYGKASHCCRNFLAVTAACLMVEKEKFWEAGGFSEDLRVAFNDVDFCFTLHELGYYNVCINDVYAYHHESLSRGDDESAEKLKRLLKERNRLYEKHPKLEGWDPYYSECLNRDGLDVRIRPAYLTAGNCLQSIAVVKTVTGITNYREDKCLMVRVEDVRAGRIVGWSVVVGDNNACYEKQFLLRSCRNPEIIYGIVPEGQYRPDLEENMPDQKNVALSGFWLDVSGAELPKGIYQIGMTARNLVTGLKLINWNNRTVEL